MAAPNTGIRFLNDAASSAITISGEKLQVIQGVAVFPGLVIELLNSDNTVNTTDTTVGVSAVCGNAVLTGQRKTVANGRFTFPDLTLKACSAPCKLVFTADGGLHGWPVEGTQLLTGDVTVEPVPNDDVMFGSTSYLKHGGVAAVATLNSVMPAVVLKLIDSCGSLDATETGLTFTATASAGTLGGTTTATVSSGVAVFTNLMFTVAPPAGTAMIRFTADTTKQAGPVNGKSITSGTVTVSAKQTPSSQLLGRVARSGSTSSSRSRSSSSTAQTFPTQPREASSSQPRVVTSQVQSPQSWSRVSRRSQP